jgi:hypothetical protein
MGIRTPTGGDKGIGSPLEDPIHSSRKGIAAEGTSEFEETLSETAGKIVRRSDFNLKTQRTIHVSHGYPKIHRKVLKCQVKNEACRMLPDREFL